MRILALEPYYGGSHHAFLDGWSRQSRHDWTLLSLPPYKWKWRMRHAAVTLADRVDQLLAEGGRWDLLFCSDMLNLAEFQGLVRRSCDLPTIAYFHENQLTYPVRFEHERDYQFAMTNMTTALAADAVWFNSAYHRDSFLSALEALLRRMPDYQPLDAVPRIAAKSQVVPPGVDVLPPRGNRPAGPLRILWAARWEHDKNPEEFFEALTLLKQRGVPFRLSVIGEQFRDVPAVFARAREQFREEIDRWGHQPTRSRYEAALCEADVFVSTAHHEFFGLSAVEAALAGARPVLPRRLAYPEVFGTENDAFFYEGGAEGLAARMVRLAEGVAPGDRDLHLLRERLRCFEWPSLTSRLDTAAETVWERHQS